MAVVARRGWVVACCLVLGWLAAGWLAAGWRPAGWVDGWLSAALSDCSVSRSLRLSFFGAMLGAHLQDDQVQGAIFDIDGTLLDSMSGYFPSWEYACAKHGLTITIEQFFGYAGQPMNDIARHIYLTQKGEAAPPGFVELFMEDKEQGMKQIYVSVGLNELRI